MTARFLNCSSTTVVFPSNGATGTSTAQRGNASTGANTTYTATTGVDVNAAIPGAGTVAGDYVFTADGFWGIVTAYSGVANNTVVTVDGWRAMLTGLFGTPAATNAYTIYSACETARGPVPPPTRLIYSGGAGASTVVICNANGANLLSPFVFAANASPISIDLVGLTTQAPFGLKASAGTAVLLWGQ